MNRFGWMIAITLSLSGLYATSPEKIEMLAAKAFVKKEKGYFVLSDGSCWQTIALETRWRSLFEWWNNVELSPENYHCIPNDWQLGSRIEVFPKGQDLEFKEEDATNASELRYYTHYLVNDKLQVLFAKPLSVADCIVYVANESKQLGYEQGMAKGEENKALSATSHYEKGYREGYLIGHEAAASKGIKSTEEAYDRGFNEGQIKAQQTATDATRKNYETGYSEGHKIGYDKGLKKGSSDTQETYEAGYSEGYKSGYQKGSSHSQNNEQNKQSENQKNN